MTKTVSFTTPRGTDITIAIVTERTNSADHNFTAPCYDLDIRAGSLVFGGADIVEVAGHGACLKPYTGSTLIPIPADKLAEVRAILDEYNAETSRRFQAALEADDRYQACYENTVRAMDADPKNY